MPVRDWDSALPMGPYRVLDLTEGGMNWCGKVLADLGADVIKIEAPKGSATRRLGPFYDGQEDPERSLYWYAYCLNKRGITLNLDSHDGRRIFKDLAAGAEFVLESFRPGYMSDLGIGYETLSQINPGLVMTSITPFGQTGPYSQYTATDIVAWSMGGMQYVTGDDDRPPVRIGFPQAELQAGAQAAAGSMVAFWHRQRTGEGQHVDVSMQVTVVWTLMNATSFPQLHGTNVERAGAYRKRGSVDVRAVYACRDGFVSVLLGSASLPPLIRWMKEDGFARDLTETPEWLRTDIDDIKRLDHTFKDFQEQVGAFFSTKSKAELYERAISDRILLAPCNDVADIWEDPQLRARDFWVDVYQPEVKKTVTTLGPFVKLSETPIATRLPAPIKGEHNEEIYLAEMGLTRERLAELGRLGIV